ncbi:putative nitrite reductase [Klebsiella pneumoniae]|uniref:Putative nitrite reductase n=1 Tax=Klebsiella pneumoniae TaxID=573 RepID=A0A377WM08_KLEPN|nr:putative nitrite reductase [Klebsiella pneumoniae]
MKSHWDKLVLATGSYPFVPPIPGNDLAGCFVYRTLDDLDRIAAHAAAAKSGVVIGGGLLGLEAANALKQLGLETQVVEFAPNLMAVQLDNGGAAMLREKIVALGVGCIPAKRPTAIVREADGLRLNFADGGALRTDMWSSRRGSARRTRWPAAARCRWANAGEFTSTASAVPLTRTCWR